MAQHPATYLKNNCGFQDSNPGLDIHLHVPQPVEQSTFYASFGEHHARKSSVPRSSTIAQRHSISTPAAQNSQMSQCTMPDTEDTSTIKKVLELPRMKKHKHTSPCLFGF